MEAEVNVIGLTIGNGSTEPYLNVAQDYFRDLSRLLLSTSSVDEPLPPARIAGFRQSRRQEVPMTQTQTITPLRQRMLDDMKLRNLAAGTRKTYVRSVANFSAFRCAAEPSSMVIRVRMVRKSFGYRWRS